MVDPQNPLGNSKPGLVKVLLLRILALHLKCLTRRDLLGLQDLPEGGLGLIPCGLRAPTSLDEFGNLPEYRGLPVSVSKPADLG